MKKLLVVLGLLLVATMLFLGCGDTTNTTTAGQQGPQNYDKTGTLQGKIMDAVTNAPLGNDSNSTLQVWLIQGTSNRTASKLITDKNDPNVGEYAISGIPVDGNDNGDVYFKIVVVKPGYQRFEAEVYLSAYGWQVCQNTYYNQNQTVCLDYYNSVINIIGNIYLFPTGYRADDLKVVVLDPDNTRVPNAVVGLYQESANNYSPATLNTGDVYDTLWPDNGLYTDMSTTTDANGVATFSGSKLVLGGRYKVMVAPMKFNNQVLYFGLTHVTELSANLPVIIKLDTQAPALLWATSASNQVTGSIAADGKITVVFNQPIVLATTAINATMNSTSTATFNTPQATGAVSPDGLTLTITPNFFAAPTEKGATVTYTVPTIYTKSNQAAYPTFTNIYNLGSGENLKDYVQMIAY